MELLRRRAIADVDATTLHHVMKFVVKFVSLLLYVCGNVGAHFWYEICVNYLPVLSVGEQQYSHRGAAVYAGTPVSWQQYQSEAVVFVRLHETPLLLLYQAFTEKQTKNALTSQKVFQNVKKTRTV